MPNTSISDQWYELRSAWSAMITSLKLRISPRLRRDRRSAIQRYQVYRRSRSADLYRTDGRFRGLMEVHAVAIDMAELRQRQLATMLHRRDAEDAGVRTSPYSFHDCELVAAEAIRWIDLALRMDGKLPPADPISQRIDAMMESGESAR